MEKFFEQFSTLDPKQVYNFLHDLKHNFLYYLNSYENFSNLVHRYGLDISNKDYLLLSSDINLRDKIKQALNYAIENKSNPLLAYKIASNFFGYKNPNLELLAKSIGFAKMTQKTYKTAKTTIKAGVKLSKYTIRVGKYTINVGNKLFRVIVWLLDLLWPLLLSIFGFIFSATGLITILVLVIIIAFVGIIALLLTLLYQPLLNVPVKFSSFEMYVPLNNDEVAFRNINVNLQKLHNQAKNNYSFTTKMLDTLTANLANKNTVMLFLKNNQADLAKNFIYKCSKYSLISKILINYKKESQTLSGQITALSGDINNAVKQLTGLQKQLSGLNNQVKQQTDQLLRLTDNISLYENSFNKINNILNGTGDKELANIISTGDMFVILNENNTGYFYLVDKNKNIFKLPLNTEEQNYDIKNIANNVLGEEVFIKNISNGVSNLSVLKYDYDNKKDILWLVKNKLNKYKVGNITSFLDKLYKTQKQISSKISQLNNQINDIKNKIDNLKKIIKQTKEKIDFLKIKLEGVKKDTIEQLKTLGVDIENANSSLIEGDLFNNGFGVNKVFYAWYKKQLAEKGYAINNQICKNVEHYAYIAYIAPSWKQYNDTMVPGGDAYTMLFLDDINSGQDKEVDHNITQKDYDIFQKYYNSIVNLYKQLGDIKVLKNWISGKFIVRPQGLLGMDVLTNENQSVVNIYNPFLWEKNSITLLQADNTLDNNRYFINYKGFDIDISKFNNWFHDIGINNLTKLPNNNGLDILYDSKTKDTYIPIKVDNNVLNKTCGIQGSLSKPLTIFIKYDGNWYYNYAVNAVAEYNRCIEGCGKGCDPYEDCYKPIFIKDEQRTKQNRLNSIYNGQLNDFCSQLDSYLSKFNALDFVKKDKVETKPSKIRVCYEEKPVFFNYMFKYDILAYNKENGTFGGIKVEKLLDTREDKYHYTQDNMYVPYLYKVRLPYKVCYDIDNIYLSKKLKEALEKKGGTLNNYSKDSGKLGFVLDSHIDLNLISSLSFKGTNFPVVRETDKILFNVLNKGANFNPIHLLYYLKQKNILFSTLGLDLKIRAKTDKAIYRGFNFNVGPGQENISIENARVSLSTRYTSEIDRQNTLDIQLDTFGFNYKHYVLKYDLAGWSKIKRREQTEYNFDIWYNGQNIEPYIKQLYEYNQRYIKELNEDRNTINSKNDKLLVQLGGGLDFDVDKFDDNDFIKTMINHQVVNTFKLKENFYIATTLNFIKSNLFNIDLANLKNNNNLQSLLYIGDKEQVKQYYTFHLVNKVIKADLEDKLNIQTENLEKQLENNLNQIKQQYQLAKSKINNGGIWDKIKNTITGFIDTISNLVSQTKTITYNIISNVGIDLKQRINLVMNNTVSRMCALTLNPGKCILNNIDVINYDNYDMLDKLYKEYELGNAKGGLGISKVYTKDILGDNYKLLLYGQDINISDIILNPFYSLFRKTEDKKTEEKLGIYSLVSNILTDTNPNNVLNTLGIDKYNLNVLVGNMLSNNYIIDRIKTALDKIILHGAETKALDNLSTLKFDNIDIDDVNDILFKEFHPFEEIRELKDSIIRYYTSNISKSRSIKIPLYNLWFIYHAYSTNYGVISSPLISQIDEVLKKQLGEEKFLSLVKGIKEHKIEFHNDYAWYDIIGRYNDDNKQYEQFRDIINKVRSVFNNTYVCLGSNNIGDDKVDLNKQIVTYSDNNKNSDSLKECDKGVITLSTKNTKKIVRFLQYLYGDNSINVDDNIAEGLIDTAKFLADYGNQYGDKGFSSLGLLGVIMLAGDKPYTDTNIFIALLLKASGYLKQGYTYLNMDTNWIYRLFNSSKIEKSNDISYTTYLINVFTQIDINIKRLKQLQRLLIGIKEKKQIYEVADVYLLDLLANQNNYLDNISYVNIHTYTQLKDYINGNTLPIFSQYSLFDAVSKKTQIGYLNSFLGGVELDNYYFNLFKQELKNKIDCEKTFTGDNILINKCIEIKQDLLSSNNITDFKFKMTKYAKEYDFVELWKQVGGLLYFTYQNQKFLGQAWDFRQTDEYKELTAKYGPNWVHKIAGALGNCTWYANYLHWKSSLPQGGGIGGNAKDWCRNAENMGLKVIYTKDIVNPEAQIKIGDIVVFNENYPTYYNYQMKTYGTVYGHVGTLIGIDDNNNAILVEEMNYTSIVKGGSTLWIVDRRWDTDWQKSVKCFIETNNFDWKYEDNANSSDSDK